ncbi:MAG: hypothetical protein SO101_03490 [Lachnospiraceae bacterium]|nr:hypothetical protein [Lachnospiraceae bacterium]
MSEKKRKGLKRLLSMVLAIVMVVSSGFLGKLDVRADDGTSICKVTVVVTDQTTGNVIEDAEVIFTDYYSPYDPITVTRNEDGTYNLPYPTGSYEYYRYYATAVGYKDSRTYNSYRDVWLGASTGPIEKSEQTLGAISLALDPATERLQNAITSAQNEISGYLDKSVYDSEQVTQIESIITTYIDRISNEIVIGAETEESANAKIKILNGIVKEAKEELDKVTTSQDRVNEENIDSISFVPESGETKSFARQADTNYGKFEITLSRFEKGTFKVDNDADTSVTWDAKKAMQSYSAGGQYLFEIIDNTYDKGVFFNSKSFAADVNLNEAIGTIKDCSVTFTKNEKPITVTFDLIIKGDLPSGVSVKVPDEAVELSRDDNLNYTTALKYGKDYSAKLAYYSGTEGEDLASDAVKITSEDESIAVVDENLTIKPLKAGDAAFKAVYTDENQNTFEKEFTITFKMNETETNEAAAAAEVEEKIAALGTEITLEKEDAVKDAKAAYDELSAGAKKKVSEESLKALQDAVEKISDLKDSEKTDLKARLEAALKAQEEAEEKAAAAEKRAEEAEEKAAAAEKAQKAAETKAAAAEKAQKAAEEKAAAAEKRAEEAEKAQKAAEDKAAAAVKAQKTAEDKAAAAEKAQKTAEDKAAAAVKAQKAAEDKATFKTSKPSVTAKAAAYNQVKITWKKYANATSYIVYRKTSGTDWKLLKETTALSYTDKTAATGTTYYYTVKAVSTTWGGKVYSQSAASVKAKTALTTPAVSSVTSSKTKQAAVTWKKVSGASGYVVYRATSKNGTYKAVKTIKSGSTVKYTDTKLTKGKTYYYKVKAYRTVNGKKVYSSYSSVKSVKSK